MRTIKERALEVLEAHRDNGGLTAKEILAEMSENGRRGEKTPNLRAVRAALAQMRHHRRVEWFFRSKHGEPLGPDLYRLKKL